MSSTCPICFETFQGRIKARPETDGVCPIDRMKFRNIINLESLTTIQIKPRKRRHKRILYDVSTYCEVCKGNSDTFLLCDCCDLAFHSSCLTPPLTNIPAGRWYCPDCVAVESRLRANRGTTADRRISTKYLRKRRKRKRGALRKEQITRKLTIHYSETHHSQRQTVSASLGDCLTMESTPEKNNEALSDKCGSSYSQYDDQPAPSCSSTSTWEDTSASLEDYFNFSNSDFDSSSSEESELDNIIDCFHQQEELSNTATFAGEGPSNFVDEDEFQDYDFDGFDGFSSSENENGEALTSNQEKDSSTFDKLVPSVVSSEPCTTVTSTKVGVTKVPTGNMSKYKQTESGCYLASPQKRQNAIDAGKKLEDCSFAKQNNTTLNDLNSSSSERDFMKSLIKDKDVNKAIDSCIISSSEKSQNGIDGVINSEESLHAELNNPTVNNCNSSSNKIAFIKCLNKVRLTESGCYLASPENAINVGKEPEDSSLAKENNPTVNNFNSSSPKRNFMKSLKARYLERTKDLCNSSAYEKSKNEMDSAVESEESLHAKQKNSTINGLISSYPKRDFKKDLKENSDFNKTPDSRNSSSSENSKNTMDGRHVKQPEESLHGKQNNLPVTFSSYKINVMQSLKEARDLYRTIDGCNTSSCESSQKGIDGLIASEESSLAKQNNPTISNFKSLFPKTDFSENLKEYIDFNRTTDCRNTSSSESSKNEIDNALESVESLHAKQKNPNYFISSYPKRYFKKDLKENRDLNKTIDSRNSSSSENSKNMIDGRHVKQPEESLHGKQNNLPVTFSSYKINFMQSLKEARDLNRTIDGCNTSSSESSQKGIDGLIESEESSVAKQNSPTISNFNSLFPKTDFSENLKEYIEFNRRTDCRNTPSSESSKNGIDGMMESEENLLAKPNNPSSSPKRDFRNNLKDTDLWKTRDNSNSSSFENSKNRIDNVKQLEDSLHAEQNNLTVNDFKFSSYKIDFMKSLNKAKDLNISINSCNILSSKNSPNGVDGMIESEGSSHAKPINPTINDFNASSPKIDCRKNLKEDRDLNKTRGDVCNTLSSDTSRNGIDNLKQPGDSLHAKQKNSTVNDYNYSSPKRDFMKSLKEARDLNRILDGCKTSSSENSQNRINGVTESEESSLVKLNNSTINNFNSSSPKRNFTKSLIVAKYLKRTKGCCNSSPYKKSKNGIDSIIEFEENFHAKGNNPTRNKCNSSFPKTDSIKNLKEVIHLNRTRDGRNTSSFESSQNRIDGVIEPEESLFAKPNNSSSSPKRDFRKNLIEDIYLNCTIDGSNTTSSENSQNIVDGVIDSEESLHAKQNISTRNYFNSSSKRNLMKSLKKARDCKRTIDDVMESAESSHAKHNLNVKEFFSSSPEKEIWKSVLKKARNPLKTEFSHFEDTSSKKRGGNRTNKTEITCYQQVKRKTFDDLEPDFTFNPSKKATSTFENNASDFNTSPPEICESKMGEKTCKERKEQNQNDSDSSSSASNKIVNGDTFKVSLCPKLEDNDDNSNSTSSMDNGFPDYHKAILLKLPLRLSFKRTPKMDQGVTSVTSTNATVDNISASICKIASVTSLQQLDTETASCSHDSLLSNIATISTDQVLQTQDSTNKNKPTKIVGCSDIAPSISIPITFSLIEEQSAFEPFQTKNTGFLNSGESCRCIENPWSNFYSNMARGTNTAGVKRPNEEQTQIETIPAKKLRKDDYTLSMDKSGKLTIPSNVSHVFGKRVFIKDMKQLSVRKDGALFLNWKKFNS